MTTPHLVTAAGGQPLIRAADIPTRLSAHPQHPDYDRVWSPRVRGVFLDGVELADVVRFDTREGWVEVLERDDQGAVITVQLAGRTVAATTTRHGELEVRMTVPRQLLGPPARRH